MSGNEIAGPNNITPELIKFGGRTPKQRIHKLILKEIPAQWAEGIIAPIHRKSDKLVCHNYRPITLLNISYKIFAILLNNSVTCFTRQHDKNNVDSSDLTREFIATIAEITHNRYNTQFRV
jgi:hypothetical protein